jgi:hypothetical protein
MARFLFPGFELIDNPEGAVAAARKIDPTLMNAIQYTLAAALFSVATTQAQSPSIDPTLAAQIATIPAIDNHAHPLLSPPAYASDRNFDALPVDNMEPETDPANLRPTLPALHEAWQAIFHFNGTPPLDAEGLKQLEAAREATRREQGEAYATYILDRANIATELANRVAMGTGVQPPRFRWVPYVDALLFPLDNSALATTPDRKQFFPLEDKLRAQYLQQANLKTLPPTLDLYLKQLVTPILEQQKSRGAVAEKFEIAYLRSFGFDDVPRPEAARIYATLLHPRNQIQPSTSGYRISSSATSPPSAAASTFPSTSTPPPVAEATSTSPATTRCCSNPCSTTPTSATPTSSSSTEAGPSSTRSAHSCKNPTSTWTSRNNPS